MPEYITDENGKWKAKGTVKVLIEPSETYLQKQEQERLELEEQELLKSLEPTAEEVKQSEFNVMGINLLMEVGLL